jgi:hypothetical protein
LVRHDDKRTPAATTVLPEATPGGHQQPLTAIHETKRQIFPGQAQVIRFEHRAVRAPGLSKELPEVIGIIEKD